MNTKTKKTTLLEHEKIQQFPELNFYSSEDAWVYFDATHYLIAKDLCTTCSIDGFCREFSSWISPFQKVYDCNPEDMFVLDEQTGHQLIDEAIAILFIAYTDETYRVMLIERMSEMEITGITLSNSRLIEAVRNRFSTDFIAQIMTEYGKE